MDNTLEQMSLMMEKRLETDSFFNYAALAYNYAVFLTENKNGFSEKLNTCICMVSECIDKLIILSGATDLKNEAYLSALNHTDKVAEIAKWMDKMKVYKAVADGFKGCADIIRVSKPGFTLAHFEALVNARRYNKRLSKELSAYLKSILNDDVHSVGGFWDMFPETKTLTGRLRKLWIQCMSLRVYKYNPDLSYTQTELEDIVENVLDSEDAKVHYLFCQLLYDCKIDCVVIKDYEAILNRLMEKAADEADVLLFMAAILLNSINVERPAYIDKMIKSTEGEEKPYDLEAAVKLRPTWGRFVVEYLGVKDKGVSLRDFCEENRLPYAEFSRFYTAMIADVEKTAQEDPFLRKLATLPLKDQDEYADLMKSRRKVMQQVCDAVSRISGQKVEIKDLFGDDGKVDEKLDRKMNEALESPDKTDVYAVADFMFGMNELSKVESKVDAFLTERGL